MLDRALDTPAGYTYSGRIRPHCKSVIYNRLGRFQRNRCSCTCHGRFNFDADSRSMSMKKPQKGDIVELLLAAGADINAKDKNNMTALKVTQQCECGAGGGMYSDYLIERGAK